MSIEKNRTKTDKTGDLPTAKASKDAHQHLQDEATSIRSKSKNCCTESERERYVKPCKEKTSSDTSPLKSILAKVETIVKKAESIADNVKEKVCHELATIPHSSEVQAIGVKHGSVLATPISTHKNEKTDGHLDQNSKLVNKPTQQIVQHTDQHIVQRIDSPPLTVEIKHRIEQTKRLNAHTGHMKIAEARAYFMPEPKHNLELDDLKSAANGSKHLEPFVVSSKKVLSSLFSPDKDNVYDTVRPQVENSFAVGKYGLTTPLLQIWLNETLGNPPDWRKVNDLANRENLSASLGERMRDTHFRSGFLNLLNNISGKHDSPSKDDIEDFLPGELQEVIAGDLIRLFGAQANNDPGKVALAFWLGKAPNELSPSQSSDPTNAEYQSTASRLYALAQAVETDKDGADDDELSWQETGNSTSPIAIQIAKHALDQAPTSKPGGKCSGSVQLDLAATGIPNLAKWCGKGDAWNLAEKMKLSREWIPIDPKLAERGDLVAKKNNGYGHVELVAKKDSSGFLVASDFQHHVKDLTYTNNGYYSETQVLRYVGDKKTELV